MIPFTTGLLVGIGDDRQDLAVPPGRGQALFVVTGAVEASGLGHHLFTLLRPWAEGLLGAQRLQSQGYFHAAPIRQKWQEHLSGARNWQHPLWTVLMLQAWLDSRDTRR